MQYKECKEIQHIKHIMEYSRNSEAGLPLTTYTFYLLTDVTRHMIGAKELTALYNVAVKQQRSEARFLPLT